MGKQIKETREVKDSTKHIISVTVGYKPQFGVSKQRPTKFKNKKRYDRKNLPPME